jgi:thioredoxin 1
MKYPRIITHRALALVVVLVGSLADCTVYAQDTGVITEVTKDIWQREVLDSKLPVFILFYSTNCAPCAQQAPMVESLAKEYAGKVKFVKVDVVDQHEVRDAFNILRVPASYVIKLDERVAYLNEGNLEQRELKEFLEDGLAQKREPPP